MDGEIFRFICYLHTELWSSKFIELDVCETPLFTNPVTNDNSMLDLMHATTAHFIAVSLKTMGLQQFHVFIVPSTN